MYLSRPQLVNLVVDALHYHESGLQHYKLHSWVVMPNHVHVLITPLIEVAKLTHSIKLFTAAEANQILNRTGQPFWQGESYDRLVRSDTEFGNIRRYIEKNSVTAGLVRTPEEFQWSSAGEGKVGW